MQSWWGKEEEHWGGGQKQTLARAETQGKPRPVPFGLAQQDAQDREPWESASHQEAPPEVDAIPETSTYLKCLKKHKKTENLVLVFYMCLFFLITKPIHVHQRKVRKSKNCKEANFHPEITTLTLLCISFLYFSYASYTYISHTIGIK